MSTPPSQIEWITEEATPSRNAEPPPPSPPSRNIEQPPPSPPPPATVEPTIADKLRTTSIAPATAAAVPPTADVVDASSPQRTNEEKEEPMTERADDAKCSSGDSGGGEKDANGFVFYKCRFCGLTYNFITTLKAHERIHDVETVCCFIKYCFVILQAAIFLAICLQ